MFLTQPYQDGHIQPAGVNNESVKITVLSSINTSLQSGTIGLSGPFKTTYWQELFTILLILLQFQSVTGHLFTKAQTK